MTILIENKIQEKVSSLLTKLKSSNDTLNQVSHILTKSADQGFGIYECLFNYHDHVQIKQEFDHQQSSIELYARFWDATAKDILTNILNIQISLRPLKHLSINHAEHYLNLVTYFFTHLYEAEMNLSAEDLINLFQFNQIFQVTELIRKDYSHLIFEQTPLYLVEIDEVILIIAYAENQQKPWQIQVIDKESKRLLKVSTDCYPSFNDAYQDLVVIYKESLSNISEYIENLKSLNNNDLKTFEKFCQDNGVSYEGFLKFGVQEISYMKQITPNRFECIGFNPDRAMKQGLGFQPWFRMIAVVDLNTKEVRNDCGEIAIGSSTFDKTLPKYPTNISDLI